MVSTLAIAVVSTTAAADVSKAWQAARDHLPASTTAVGAIDIATIVNAPSFPTLFAAVVKEERDVGEAVEIVQRACDVDPLKVVEGIVIGGDLSKEQGAIFVQLAFDRAKTTSCFKAIATAVGEHRMVIREDGNVTVVAEKPGDDEAYFVWAAPNVLVIPIELTKADAETWTGHKGAFAKSLVAQVVGQVDTKAVAWGAFASTQPLDAEDLPVTRAHGTVAYARGMLTLAVRGTFANDAAARQSAIAMKRDLASELRSKSTPHPIKKALRTIKIRAKGLDGFIDAKLGEKAFAAAFAAGAD